MELRFLAKMLQCFGSEFELHLKPYSDVGFPRSAPETRLSAPPNYPAKASTRPLRTCLPQLTQGPRSAFQTARMTTEYISWRYLSISKRDVIAI